MDIRYNKETAALLPENFDEECVHLAHFVLKQEEAPAQSVVSITLVDADEIAALNAEYRHKDGPTDVLSFPCDTTHPPFDASRSVILSERSESNPSGARAGAAGNLASCTQNAASGALHAEIIPLLLGDVIIAPEMADDLHLLVVHGLLHLLGYDHEKNKDATLMEARQEALLTEWRAL